MRPSNSKVLVFLILLVEALIFSAVLVALLLRK